MVSDAIGVLLVISMSKAYSPPYMFLVNDMNMVRKSVQSHHDRVVMKNWYK